MDLKEKNNFNSIEEEIRHWWIKTRFNYINQTIDYYNSTDLTIVEYGCGTCNNIFYLLRRSKYAPIIKAVIGIDSHFTDKIEQEWDKESKCIFDYTLPKAYKVDIVLAMDVLEHVQDDYSTLIELKNILKPNGLLLITVPAFQHLWSSHDIALGHYRRYKKYELSLLLESTGFETVKLHYVFSYIYPIVLFVRKFLRNSFKKNTDLKQNNNIINMILSILGKLEFKYGGSNYFGTSVVGIFRNNINESY